MDKQFVKSYGYARALAALAVVVLHVFQFNINSYYVMGVPKIISVVIRNSMLWAVPLFVMITGALMLDGKRDLRYKRIFSHYIFKAVVLTFICVSAGRLFDQYILNNTDKEGFKAFFIGCIRDFATASGWGTFWYLYLLTAIYLSLPALAAITRGMKRRELKYLICLLFVFLSIIPCVFGILGYESGLYMLFYTIYPLYLLLGYYYKNTIIKNRTCIIVVLSCIAEQIVLTVGCFIGGWSNLISEIDSYSFPITVIEVTALFILINQWERTDRTGPVGRTLLSIDRYTLDIYIIHVFLLNIVIDRLHFNPYAFGIWMVLLEAVALFLVSYFISRVIRSIQALFFR